MLFSRLPVLTYFFHPAEITVLAIVQILKAKFHLLEILVLLPFCPEKGNSV